jgi:hypothetical protein
VQPIFNLTTHLYKIAAKNVTLWGVSLLLTQLVFASTTLASTPPAPKKTLIQTLLTNPLGTVCKRLLQRPAERWLSANQPWALSLEALNQIDRINQDLQEHLYDLDVSHASVEQTSSLRAQTMEAALRRIQEVLIEERRRNINPVARFLLAGALRSFRNSSGLYASTLGGFLAKLMGPHYNLLLNRMVLPSAARWRGDTHSATDAIVAIHEIQHAWDRNVYPIQSMMIVKTFPWDMFSLLLQTPLTPSQRFWFESRAMGAQWELVRHLNPHHRYIIIKKLERQKSFLSFISAHGHKPVLSQLLDTLKFKQSFGDHTLSDMNESLTIWVGSLLADAEGLLADYGFNIASGQFVKDGLSASDYWNHQRDIDHIDYDFILPILEQLAALEDLFLYSYRQDGALSAHTELMLIEIALQTLNNAGLPSKEDFLRAQETHHGYSYSQLINHTYGPNGFKKFAVVMTTLSMLTWYSIGADLSHLPRVMLADVDMLFETINELMLHQYNLNQ